MKPCYHLLRMDLNAKYSAEERMRANAQVLANTARHYRNSQAPTDGSYAEQIRCTPARNTSVSMYLQPARSAVTRQTLPPRP